MIRLPLLLIAATLIGCAASGPPREKYVGQKDDPLIYVQSIADMRGGVQHFSGVSFGLRYPNEQNECRVMGLGQAKSAIADDVISESIAKQAGIPVPQNRFISVSAFYTKTASGYGLRSEESCPVIMRTILAEPKSQYLFKFYIKENRCLMDVFQIKDSGNRDLLPAIPIDLCLDTSKKQNTN